MIKYQLCCDSGHEFEGWFSNISDYEAQSAAGSLACPICGSIRIEKRPMAPAVVGRAPVVHSRAPASDTPAATEPAHASEVIDQLRAFRRAVIENSEDVGPAFAEEARRMHFGEIEERNIRGRATGPEASALVEDNVPFGVLPTLPEDQN